MARNIGATAWISGSITEVRKHAMVEFLYAMISIYAGRTTIYSAEIKAHVHTLKQLLITSSEISEENYSFIIKHFDKQDLLELDLIILMRLRHEFIRQHQLPNNLAKEDDGQRFVTLILQGRQHKTMELSPCQ